MCLPEDMSKHHSATIRIISAITLVLFIATQSGWAMPGDARSSHIRAKSAGESNTAGEVADALNTEMGQAPFSAQAKSVGDQRPQWLERLITAPDRTFVYDEAEDFVPMPLRMVEPKPARIPLINNSRTASKKPVGPPEKAVEESLSEIKAGIAALEKDVDAVLSEGPVEARGPSTTLRAGAGAIGVSGNIYDIVHEPIENSLAEYSRHFLIEGPPQICFKDVVAGGFPGIFKCSEGEILISYDEQNNAIIIKAQGFDKNRLARGLDLLIVVIKLDEERRINNIDLRGTGFDMTGCLSRSMFSIILEDSGFNAAYPEIADVIKRMYVLPAITEDLRFQERISESQIPIFQYEKKIRDFNKGILPEAELKPLISGIASLRYSKSQEIRRKALKFLEFLKDKGAVLDSDLRQARENFLREDIREDLVYIERALRNDFHFLEDTFSGLFKREISFKDIIGSRVEVNYFARGGNKQIYLVDLQLSSGEKFRFVVSSIRDAQLSQGDFVREEINSAVDNWRTLSVKGVEDAVRLGAAAWVNDWRIKHIIEMRRGGYEVSMISNDIMLISREFAEGVPLQVILRGDLPYSEKEKAMAAVIAAYRNIWAKTKDKEGIGMFVATPRAEDIVITGNAETGFRAKIVDLDTLRDGITFNEALKLFSFYDYYPPGLVSEIMFSVIGAAAGSEGPASARGTEPLTRSAGNSVGSFGFRAGAGEVEKFVAEQVRSEDQQLVREFLTKGKVVVKTSDGARFLFHIDNVQKQDGSASFYYNIDVHELASDRPVLPVGYCIFEFAFESYNKMALCCSDPFYRNDLDAIFVNSPYRNFYTGIGSTLVQLALYFTSFKGAKSFQVISISPSGYLRRLQFDDNGIFYFDRSAQPFIELGVPQIEIIAKVKGSAAGQPPAEARGAGETVSGAEGRQKVLYTASGEGSTEARSAGRDRSEFGVGTGSGLVSEPSPFILTLDEYRRALELVREAVRRTGAGLLYVGANSPEKVLDGILRSHILRDYYHGYLFDYLADFQNLESPAFHDFLDISGNNTTSKLMRYGFQLFHFERIIEDRFRAILETDSEKGAVLEIFIIGVGDGRELASLAVMITGAAKKALREAARKMVEAGAQEKDALQILEERLGRIKIVLRGIDKDSREIEKANEKFTRGEYSIDDVGSASRKSSAVLNYVNKRLPDVKGWIKAGRMFVEFETMNLFDVRATEYLRNADFVFFNLVLYQLSRPAQLKAMQSLFNMKPGAVLFSRDNNIERYNLQARLGLFDAGQISLHWQVYFKKLVENKKDKEIIWQRRSNAALAAPSGQQPAEVRGAETGLIRLDEMIREKLKAAKLNGKGRVVVAIDGQSGTFKTFISKLIKRKGIAGLRSGDIQVLERDEFKSPLSDGTEAFFEIFKDVSFVRQLVIVEGLGVGGFCENFGSVIPTDKIPDIYVNFIADDENRRQRIAGKKLSRDASEVRFNAGQDLIDYDLTIDTSEPQPAQARAAGEVVVIIWDTESYFDMLNAKNELRKNGFDSKYIIDVNVSSYKQAHAEEILAKVRKAVEEYMPGGNIEIIVNAARDHSGLSSTLEEKFNTIIVGVLDLKYKWGEIKKLLEARKASESSA